LKKLAASVSLAALALAGCATTPPAQMAADAPALVNDTPGTADVPTAGAFPMTPDGARAFVAAVEKDLFDLSVIGGRAAWINATYINDDSDALAAYFGTIGTEKGVKYASEAARYAQIQGLDFDTARKLNILRGALVPRHRRRRARRRSSTRSRRDSSRPTARAAPAFTARC
jgi:peptidyl-dipeptidase A